ARRCASSVVDCVKLLLQISQRNLFELSVSLFFLKVVDGAASTVSPPSTQSSWLSSQEPKGAISP
ncbi:hypothetical protein ALC57_01221, partial [Trachymyrmex cornetzi]